ncbi:MAG: MFS transporter, partial [Actinomycetota bacterium]|nr:MFS transporter [Actinomycetota bacterium]
MSRPKAGVVAGCALGVASGWNFGNVGAVPSELARTYGVGLATIGLLTTAMVLTHLAGQVPGGRASDRFGAARAGAVALLAICLGNLVALAAPEAAVALAGRAITG